MIWGIPISLLVDSDMPKTDMQAMTEELEEIDGVQGRILFGFCLGKRYSG